MCWWIQRWRPAICTPGTRRCSGWLALLVQVLMADDLGRIVPKRRCPTLPSSLAGEPGK
jgi:hypothetical protein